MYETAVTELNAVNDTIAPSTDKKRSVSNMPRNDADLITLAERVATIWATKTDYKLISSNVTGLKQITTNFKNAYLTKNNSKSSNSPVRNELDGINKEIDDLCRKLKSQLEINFDRKSAPSYYPEFGITKQSNSLKIATRQEDRKNALLLTIEGCKKHKLETGVVSTKSWQDLYNRYSAAVQKLVSGSGTESQNTATKTLLRDDLKEILNSIIFLIKANHPKTYKQELRVWGFLKERY